MKTLEHTDAEVASEFQDCELCGQVGIDFCFACPSYLTSVASPNFLNYMWAFFSRCLTSTSTAFIKQQAHLEYVIYVLLLFRSMLNHLNNK